MKKQHGLVSLFITPHWLASELKMSAFVFSLRLESDSIGEVSIVQLLHAMKTTKILKQNWVINNSIVYKLDSYIAVWKRIQQLQL